MAENTRRNFLKHSAAAALLGGLGVSASAKAEQKAVLPLMAPPPLSHGLDRLGEVFADNRVTILGDTDHHRQNETYAGLLTDAAMLARMQQANVKTVAIEIPYDFQPSFDALAAGKINRTQFVDEMKISGYTPLFQDPDTWYYVLGKAVQSTASRGIKIVCADDVHTAEATKLTDFLVKHVSDLEKNNPEITEQADRLVTGLFESRVGKKFNRELDKKLKDCLKNGSHMIVIFGVEHCSAIAKGFSGMGIGSTIVAVYPDVTAINTARIRFPRTGEFALDPDRIDKFNLQTRTYNGDPEISASPVITPPKADTPRLNVAPSIRR